MSKINNYNTKKREEEKKKKKKWLLLLLLLLFLCSFGYGIFKLGFSLGEATKPVNVDPTPQKMIIKITDKNGEWGASNKVKIETSPARLSLEFNESHTIFALTTSDKPIYWSSSDENCVTVSPTNGTKPTVTAKSKECTATITVKTGDVESKITVSVVKKHSKLTKIKLDKSNYSVNIGESTLATITVGPSDARMPDLIYKIQDTSVATVDENGVITGVSEGQTTLIVTTADGEFTAKATVTVNKRQTSDDVNEINIFSIKSSSRSYIAPYDKGVYEFDVKNTISNGITYELSLGEENEDHVNIKYKLKKNGQYIISDWVYYEQVHFKDVALAAFQTDSYELEWCWVSENDELDTKIGLKKERAVYTVTINVIAVQDLER